jgi:hypothetical protein
MALDRFGGMTSGSVLLFKIFYHVIHCVLFGYAIAGLGFLHFSLILSFIYANCKVRTCDLLYLISLAS